MSTLRFGTLGAARITPPALLAPARELDGVVVEGVAARSIETARAFASEHDIPRVFDGYDELIASPEIDCVYNPLPNGLHGELSMRALRAGKHVLCEKPLAANADEAEAMFAVASESGSVLVEAVHYLFHPVAQFVRDVVGNGEIGTPHHVTSSFRAPIPNLSDIRFDFALAGGALMDLGSYAVSAVRLATREEPEIVSAQAVVGPPQIDLAMEASLRFPSGATGHVLCDARAGQPFDAQLEVQGSEGRLRITHPFLPHLLHDIELETRAGRRQLELDRTPTYTYQLAAFRDHVTRGASMPIDRWSSVANLRAIDAIYAAAGLPRREPTRA